MNITTIGLDLAKNSFQVHGIDETQAVVLKRKLRRGQVLDFFGKLPSCLIGLEACASAHYWARELVSLGHEVKLIPPQYVKPYLKRQKNDAADAQAICEAVTRPHMRFVPVKSAGQQSLLMMHRARDLLIGERTKLINALRGHLAELGIVAPKGAWNISKLIAVIEEETDERLPDLARMALARLAAQLKSVSLEIAGIEKDLAAWHKTSKTSQLLATIPGFGLLNATAIAASVGDGRQFRSGRHFAAWLGLVPRQNSTGGKARLGPITKKGDGYLRRLMVCGATALLHSRSRATIGIRQWAQDLMKIKGKPARVAAVALANKLARIAWAVMTKAECFRHEASAA